MIAQVGLVALVVTALSGRISDVGHRIDVLEQRMTARFDHVDGDLRQLGERITRLELR